MKETSLSIRLSVELEKELEEFIESENLDKSTAIRKLLQTSLIEWREKTAVDLLSKGKLTFLAAAKFAGLDVWSFADKLKASKTVWIKDKETLEKDIERALA
ncbi:MAG TPA: UPF0175 family protein [archaeon]|nr:UPF0175 family protein [archaeon]